MASPTSSILAVSLGPIVEYHAASKGAAKKRGRIRNAREMIKALPVPNFFATSKGKEAMVPQDARLYST